MSKIDEKLQVLTQHRVQLLAIIKNAENTIDAAVAEKNKAEAGLDKVQGAVEVLTALKGDDEAPEDLTAVSEIVPTEEAEADEGE